MIVHCDKCGGDVELARLRTRGLEVEFVGVFSLEVTPIEARVCTECGYTELYAMRPGKISAPDVTPEPAYAGYEE